MMLSTSPFRTVIARTGGRTHLAVHSPAVVGSSADQMPTRALCGARVHRIVADDPGSVDCMACLHLAPRFMGIAGYPHESQE